MGDAVDSDLTPPTLLELLRTQGAMGFDPVRWHYLEVLERRTQAQHGAVRQVLEVKLRDALTIYQERFEHSRTAGGAKCVRPPGGVAATNFAVSALADLNRYIKNRAQDGNEPGLNVDRPSRVEMKSVRQFRKAWSMIQAYDQVEQAMEQGPENAGPLNSHRLLLRSVALMGELSPHYLQRFLSNVDSMLWLDSVNLKPKSPTQKPSTRAARVK